jgi:simple sugar transport system permease protein
VIDALLVPLLEATVRTATPLALAALGELVTERAGVINLGLEGAILAGCLVAFLAASAGGLPLGVAGGALGGIAIAALFAFCVVTLRTDQVITGTAVTLLALGVTGTVHRAMVASGADAQVTTSGTLAIPLLSRIPVLGPVLFQQSWLTYTLYLLVPALAWWLTSTHAGLALRATGERRAAAAAAGVAVDRVRWGAILFGGMMGGLAGAALVLVQLGGFNEGMSAGRGFVAIAIVVLGRWTVRGTALGALLFGGAFALQYLVQTLGLAVPYPLLLALPYALTLLLLAVQRGERPMPAELAKS